MKILIINPRLIWRGAEKLGVNLAVALKKRGHSVSYLTLFAESKGVSEGIKKINLIVPDKDIQKILRLNDFFFIFFGFWVLLFLVLQNIKKFQIINVHNVPSMWIGAILGKIYSKPVVWTVHDVPKYISWKEKTSFSEYLLWLVASSFIDRFLIRNIDFIIVQCRKVADEVEVRYNRESHIILPAVNDIFLKEIVGKLSLESKFSGKFVLLSASHMHFRKNQKTIVKAFLKFSKKVKDSVLVLAGDGPDKAKLINLVNEVSLEKRVFFIGILSEKRLAQVYRLSNLLLLASVEEPWGLTPFEALASKTPVIVSDLAGACETIRKNGIGYFSRPFVNNFYNRMIEVYRDYNTAKRIAMEGKHWVEINMTSRRYAKEYETIFNSLINNKK
ncbi:MAG: glycosyltransferase family 4 protein [bacterium]|nr:glycosyltransferase family 4 protein [bacterium]